jgi:hypothetical protein
MVKVTVPRALVRVLVGFCGLVAIGCVGSGSASSAGGGSVVAAFPSRERLDEITSQPPPRRAKESAPTVSVDRWDMVTAEAPGQDGLVEAAARPVLRLSPALACAARELGRFVAQKGGVPDQQLQNYVLGQCGAATPEHSLQYWSITLNHPTGDAELLAELAKPVKQHLGSLPPYAQDVGGALVREGQQAVYMLLVARRHAELEPIAPVAEDGTIVVSGKLLTGADALLGLVTRGDYGFDDCTMDRSLKLPRFRATCKLADDDQRAWVELQIRQPQRLLLQGAVRVLARRSAEVEAFTLPELASQETAIDPRNHQKQLLAAVNELRAKAGLRAMTLAERQSVQHEKLAPYFFASAAEDAPYADDIALGLMAGWEVPGIIREGSFYGAALRGTLSVERWLGHLLDYPMARAILFAPDARTLALGPLVDTQNASVGVLFSSYSFYESDDHEQDRKRVVALIERERRAAGSPPGRVSKDPELEAAVTAMRQGMEPGAALNDAMSVVVHRDSRSVQGSVLETMSLDDLELPEHLVTRPRLEYAVEVTHVRHPGAAWGSLVVLIIVAEPKTTTASAGSAPRG